MREIHSTAIVDSRARVGEGVKIGPFSVIGPGVVIEDGCVIHNHVTVTGRTTLGACCWYRAMMSRVPSVETSSPITSSNGNAVLCFSTPSIISAA